MVIKDFLNKIKAASPSDLSLEYLHTENIHAIPNMAEYKNFLELVKEDYPQSEHIAIMGSGNWRFSLNPYKMFREYAPESDIDIAIVCADSFKATWEELRSYHRANYSLIPQNQKSQLRRNGENVYSGFVSPKWIPGKSDLKFYYSINTNKYANETIGFRSVSMMYFKNINEAVDYYVRGFILAKGGC